MPFLTALVAAAGQGRRMGAGRNKVLLNLRGRPVLTYSLDVLESSPLVHAVIVITRREDMDQCREILGSRYSKVVGLVEGGEERQDSVYRGLKALPEETELVAVHDAARPLMDEGLLARVVAAAREWGGAVAAVPVRDTIKRDDGQGLVGETLVRQNLWAAQTPQVFRRAWLEEAYRRGRAEGWRVTDDASLVEKCGYPVKLVKGDYRNLKITTPYDLLLAAALLEMRS
ncbi:MAG: 2-C-methyl-D-erythritol 4-phosphate cytidylyltransferase [Thermoanaerobacteraceae bacterium]|uniref:2-C-methyl-D-erythritol 4-phosphate cytidylyltransferase n=1 Tax=Thermanaeromonas sp. C210 TaxID=2731925 RepID=UPI00155C877B|nr:2-C-methyl-D-erythritol 4-phosphate cytidylyltransferase [Thermanaeromonas sp. C210]MBE3580370.1 2-C-methyl-D-erythritol 4-phosphate cytidylyltransferase [Thermoanaerobacteraceae bacterium]GFN23132.1 2-C-methyl-D-erythritol 4-phosphate cytidylyltransferase [Thermanaeromonas sp. C210]